MRKRKSAAALNQGEKSHSTRSRACLKINSYNLYTHFAADLLQIQSKDLFSCGTSFDISARMEKYKSRIKRLRLGVCNYAGKWFE